jgi:hypothetical protein
VPGFTQNLGERVNDGSVAPVDTTTGSTTDSAGGATPTTSTLPSVDTSTLTASELLARADALFDEANAALAQNPPDFATYQAKLAQARELLRQAIALVGG